MAPSMTPFLYTSCNKHDLQTTAADQESRDALSKSSLLKKLKFESEMLKFENLEHYQDITVAFAERKISKEDIYEKFPEFESQDKAYYQLINSDKFQNFKTIEDLNEYSDFIRIEEYEGEKFIVPLLDFSHPFLFNKKGILIIGDEILVRRFKQEYNVKLLDYNWNKSVNENIKALNVIPKEVQFFKPNSDSKLETRGTKECSQYWCKNAGPENCSNHEYRMRTHLIVEANGSGLECGAKTRFFKRNFFAAWVLSGQNEDLDQDGWLNYFYVDIAGDCLGPNSYVALNMTVSSSGGQAEIQAINSHPNKKFACVSPSQHGGWINSSGTKHGIPKPCSLTEYVFF